MSSDTKDELSARQRYERIVTRIREYVLDYCMANAEDWDTHISKIASDSEMTPDLVEQLIQCEKWETSFACHAMSALGVVVPKYPEDWNGERFEDEDHDKACRCMDCNMHTQVGGEYYCLKNQVWYSATVETGGNGMLCIGCIENRLGRSLTADDFKPGVPINETDTFFPRSSRFLDRLSR